MNTGGPLQLDVKIDPFPSQEMLEGLWLAAWNEPAKRDFSAILVRSLGHVAAYDGAALVGFANIATDGGIHAFILDTCVAPEYRRRGVGRELVQRAVDLARERGAEWLHVDYEPHLESFYASCGFRSASAGLLRFQK